MESNFEVKQQKSAHINPSTTFKCLHLVLDKSAISCLVVPRVEAVLEDCCLDVVPSLALLEWNRLDFPSGLSLIDLLPAEVPPGLLAFIVDDGNLPFVVLDRYGVNDLTSMLVGNFKCCGIGLLKVKA